MFRLWRAINPALLLSGFALALTLPTALHAMPPSPGPAGAGYDSKHACY